MTENRDNPITEPIHDYGVLVQQVRALAAATRDVKESVNRARDDSMQAIAEHGAKLDTFIARADPLLQKYEAGVHVADLTVKAARAIDNGLRWSAKRAGMVLSVGGVAWTLWMLLAHGPDAAIAFYKAFNADK